MAKFLDGDGLLYLWEKIKTLVATKVDKVDGKILSTNDFTDAYKTKLDGIATGANAYSLPTASSSTLGGVKVGTNLSIDSSGILSSTNTTYSAATTSAAGLMSASDKSKLDGIATGANAYTLPAATSSALGGVKQGTNITIASDGTISATNTTYSAATSSANGLMSSSDKAKLDAFGAASTYALKTDLTNLYKYKGSKSSYSNLPTSGNTTGDVWNVEDTDMNYAWNGSAWDPLGTTFTISAISNSEIDTIVAS